MRIVAIDAFGETPAVREVAKPASPAPGSRLVRVHAAGVNPVDDIIASGLFKPFPITFPYTLGLDFAGVDEATGEQIYGRAVGSYADYVIVHASDATAPIPRSIDFAEAAAIPSAAMTALTSVDAAGIERGSKVLIVGAAGGVGSFAVQFASQRGAHVLATARATDAEYVKRLGATETVDYTQAKVMFPQDLDALLDFASDGPALGALSLSVRDGGSVISTRYVADIENLARRNVRGVNVSNKPSSELLLRVNEEIERGALVMPELRKFPLAEAANALALFDHGHVRGKLVLVTS